MAARNFEAPVDLDANNLYDVTRIATDADGNVATDSWTVTVTDVVEAATVAVDAIANSSIAENQGYQVTATTTATGVGGIVWSLGGADVGAFPSTPAPAWCR